jgi:hypothetical protein
MLRLFIREGYVAEIIIMADFFKTIMHCDTYIHTCMNPFNKLCFFFQSLHFKLRLPRLFMFLSGGMEV